MYASSGLTHFQPCQSPGGTRTSSGLCSPRKNWSICPVVGDGSCPGAAASPAAPRPSKSTSLIIPLTQTMLSYCASCRCQPLTTPGRAVSYTHLRAHETDSYLVCRLLLE